MPPSRKTTDVLGAWPHSGLKRTSRHLVITEQSDLTSSDDDYHVDQHPPRRAPFYQTHETIQVQEASHKKQGGASKARSLAILKCHRGPITIKGIELQPTIVFDTFWRFATERKAIDDRRRSGSPQP